MAPAWQLLVLLLAALSSEINAQSEGGMTQQPETWTGRWLPERPHETPVTTVVPELQDHKHGVKMGVKSVRCDNAKINLTVDWDYNPINYTCFYPTHRIRPDLSVRPLLECENIPKKYSAAHICMRTRIHYQSKIPTFGPHRPLWAKYGEFTFVPVQRWLHNLEHGAVVMLYHPCANQLEVARLRTLVTGCIRKHVITPYTLLDVERPLALVAWGCRLTMNVVDDDTVEEFIKKYALKGPEKIDVDGQYREGLVMPAANASKMAFTELCPH
ncbi:uncharacterized protein LOC134532996 [Bacillus rossius redtenbacheri]|uniref:uncharacterized protein LOC134532996 n=1 Tax=Bacillus rossius redtenbacheri TaxID=93214 RepID=UPI002FDE72BD